MPARPVWNGHLKLSLVTCAVSLFPATTQSEKISFHMLNEKTGHRLKQQYVDEESHELIERDQRIRGYDIGNGAHVEVSEEDLDSVEIASTKTIEIDTFVEASEIDRVYFDTCYFCAPDDKAGVDAFTVIRDAMRDKAMVGIGRIVMYRREHPVLLEARGNGILATTLRFAYEVRDDAPYLAAIQGNEVSKDMVDLAGYIIEKRRDSFDPDKFTDRYQDALKQLIDAKKAGNQVLLAKPEQSPSNVFNLMDALRASLSAPGTEKPATTKGKPIASKEVSKPRKASALKSAGART